MYRTRAPMRRSARPSTAAPGGPSVSGMPSATMKPVTISTEPAPVSARAAAWRAARPEESRDAPPGGIESEQVVDRVKADAGGGHGSGRYHTLRLTS